MIEFKPITLSDRDWAEPLIRAAGIPACEYSFANNFLWAESSSIEIANLHERYLVKWGKTPRFLFPVGTGDLKACVDALIRDCAARKIELQFTSVPEQGKEALTRLYPEAFSAEADRDTFDYIYNTEDLIHLRGKKYHAKRNFLNRFYEKNWSFEPITPENIDQCAQMNAEWAVRNDCDSDPSKQKEQTAVKRALGYFFELGLVGCLIRLEGEIVAFTIGEPLTEDTFVVHIEKAFSDVPGAYPAINKTFATHFASGYRYLNREDDAGSEGLRKAKLSYHPARLLEKYTMTYTR